MSNENVNSNWLQKITSNNFSLFLLFGMLTWIAFYFKMSKFGLYEDDYWFVGIPATLSFQELVLFLKDMLFDLERGQGRFIGSFLPNLLAFFTFKTGGLVFTYFFGILLVALNAYLVTRLLRFRFNNLISITAGVVFIIFPGDTTKALLVHIYQLQLSVFFILMAFNFYINRKKFLGYMFALFCLWTYESPFLPFVFAPLLLDLEWKKGTVFEFLKHNLILMAFIFAMFVFRKFVGEERVAELVMTEFAMKTTAAFIIGPAFSLFSFINALYESILNLQTTYPFIISAGLILTAIIYGIGKPDFNRKIQKYTAQNKTIHLQVNVSKEADTSIKLLITASLMLIVAYAFSITHFPPTDLSGRGTSVHLGATIGTSLFVASFINLIVYKLQNVGYQRMVYAMIILIFSIVTGYGVLIQNDYVQSWDNQKNFWANVLENAPDINENTHILVKADTLNETEFVYTYSWALPMVLNQIYDYPESWKDYPRLTVLGLNMEKSLTGTAEGDIYFEPTYPFLYNFEEQVILPQHNVILLELNKDGMMKRITGTYKIDSSTLYLKEISGNEIIHFKPTDLYPYFFDNQVNQ